MTDKKIANILLTTKAVKLNIENHFTFASGIKSPIYCDNRFLLGFPEARDTIIQAFISNPLIQEAEVITGTSTAGIPWASIIADRLKKPLAYVRGEAKAYGAGKIIEGAEITNKKTVVIEDLISTGGSSKKVLDHLLQNNAFVNGIVAIFSYDFPESHIIFGNIIHHSLCNFSTLLEVAQNEGFLSEKECELASSWNKAPKEWKI